jgi:hypothetical protein
MVGYNWSVLEKCHKVSIITFFLYTYELANSYVLNYLKILKKLAVNRFIWTYLHRNWLINLRAFKNVGGRGETTL